MDYTQYLDQFKIAAEALNSKLLNQKQIEVEVGEWLNSVVLRMQKKHWANQPFTQPQRNAGIFFSIWLSAESVKQQRICYNIHALKLRDLKCYKVTSRKFAGDFRERFKPFESCWPNVSTAFGPLTLMEGWIQLDPGNLEKDVKTLAESFLEIDVIIDELLIGK